MALQVRTSYVARQNVTRSKYVDWSRQPAQREGRPNRQKFMAGNFKGDNRTRQYRSFLTFGVDKVGMGFIHKAELVLYASTTDGIGSNAKTRIYGLTNAFQDHSGGANEWTTADKVNPGHDSSRLRHNRMANTSGAETRIDVTPLVGMHLDLWQRWRRADGTWQPGQKRPVMGFVIMGGDVQSERYAFHSATSASTSLHPRLEITYDLPNQPPNHITTISPWNDSLHGEPFTGEFQDPNEDMPQRIRVQVMRQDNDNIVWDAAYTEREADAAGLPWVLGHISAGYWHWQVPSPGRAVLKGNIPYKFRAKGFDHGGKDSGWTFTRVFTLVGTPPTVTMRPVPDMPTVRGYTFAADWTAEGATHIQSYRVQLREQGDTWGDNKWDEAFTFVTQVDQANKTVAWRYNGPNLDAGVYEIRVLVIDDRGVASEWSAGETFTLSVGSEESLDDGTGFPPYSTGFKRENSPARIILHANDGANRGPGTVKAIIEDAANIGFSQVVNEPGEFYFTLPATHPQAGECEPWQRHWTLQQYRRGSWRDIGSGLLSDFDAGDNDIIVYGLDYLGVLAKSVDTRFPAQDKFFESPHAEGGARYVDEKISDIVYDQLQQVGVATPDSPLGFIAMGNITNINEKTHIYSTFKERLTFIRGLIASAKQGTGKRTRLKVRKDPAQQMRWEWDLRSSPGLDRDDLRMEYGSTLQNFRVIGMGEDYATRVHAVGTKPLNLKPYYAVTPPSGTSDFLTSTFGSLQRVDIWNDIDDENDLKRRAKQLQKEVSKVGQRIRLAIRVHSIDPFDGYDLADNIPLDITRGLVDTARYGSGYWTLWGLEYRVYPDGHDELTWAIKPREDTEDPDADLIPSVPIHNTPEWYIGTGTPQPPGTEGLSAEEANAVYWYDTVTGTTYQRIAPLYNAWVVQASMMGPPGAEGPEGPTGPDGPPGDDGALWYDGDGDPNISEPVGSKDGDFYLDNLTGDVWTRAGGTWTLQTNIEGPEGPEGTSGADGDDGLDGATWHSGSGAPSAGLGADGDRYLDNDTGDVYLKTGGAWAVDTNIEGPPGDPGDPGVPGDPGDPGAPGSVWHEGVGVPSDTLGVDGDYYLNTATGDVYLKAAGTWGSPIANFTGPTGPPGPVGDENTPAQVQNVAAVASTEEQSDGTVIPVLAISWDALSPDPGDLTGYEVQWDERSGDTEIDPLGDTPADWVTYFSKTVGPDVTSAVLTDILGETAYDIRVRAHDTEGKGVQATWSSIASVLALGDEVAPITPLNPVAHGGYRMASLVWTQNGEPDLLHYEVEYQQTADAGTLATLTSKQNAVIIGNLTEDVEYTLRVRAVDRSGNSSGWTTGVTATPTLVGQDDVVFDQAVVNDLVATGTITADAITTGTLTVGGDGLGGSAPMVQVFDQNTPANLMLELTNEGLLGLDPQPNPDGSINAMLWAKGALKFTTDYQSDGSTVWTTGITGDGITADAILLGSAPGGNNMVPNSGFELAPLAAELENEWADDWTAAEGLTSSTNMTTAGVDLTMADYT